jgi:hypothetical protein
MKSSICAFFSPLYTGQSENISPTLLQKTLLVHSMLACCSPRIIIYASVLYIVL